MATGLLYDHLGTYNIAFHIAGCPPILGAILMFFIPKTVPVSLGIFLLCFDYFYVQQKEYTPYTRSDGKLFSLLRFMKQKLRDSSCRFSIYWQWCRVYALSERSPKTAGLFLLDILRSLKKGQSVRYGPVSHAFR